MMRRTEASIYAGLLSLGAASLAGGAAVALLHPEDGTGVLDAIASASLYGLYGFSITLLPACAYFFLTSALLQFCEPRSALFRSLVHGALGMVSSFFWSFVIPLWAFDTFPEHDLALTISVTLAGVVGGVVFGFCHHAFQQQPSA